MDELPLSFGKKRTKYIPPKRYASPPKEEKDTVESLPSNNGNDRDNDKSPEPTDNIDQKNTANSDNDLEENQQEWDDYLPNAREAVLHDHTRTVSALSVDPSGSRIVSGSYDYSLKLWDFAGMDESFRPFRTLEPGGEGSYQIHDVSFSPTGDLFLVATGLWTPIVYDRDGSDIGKFNKGDMYLRDLRNTAGHIAEISSASWNPLDGNIFITASADSTIRIWDVNYRAKSQSTIVVKSKGHGQKTKITAAAYSRDARVIAGAGLDGALHLYNTSSKFIRPNATIEQAHSAGIGACGIAWSSDNHTIATRSQDGTVKQWDTRKFKTPLAVVKDLPCLNDESNIIFSPDDRYILTGTAGSKAAVVPGRQDDLKGGSVDGKLVVLRKQGLESVHQTSLSQGSVVRVEWNEKINQIFASTSLGAIHVLYDPTSSINGVMLSVSRSPKKRAIEDVFAEQGPGTIVTPHALPMYRDTVPADRPSKRQYARDRMDATKSQRPLPPISGPGKGGRVGASATQHIVQGMMKDNSRDEDPREALLKYADKSDPMWTKAWSETQPKPVFDTYELDKLAEKDRKQRERDEQEQKEKEKEKKR